MRNHIIFFFVLMNLLGCSSTSPLVEIEGYVETGVVNTKIFNIQQNGQNSQDSLVFIEVANDIIVETKVHDKVTGYSSIFVEANRRITLNSTLGSLTDSSYVFTPKGAHAYSLLPEDSYALFVSSNPLLEGVFKGWEPKIMLPPLSGIECQKNCIASLREQIKNHNLIYGRMIDALLNNDLDIATQLRNELIISRTNALSYLDSCLRNCPPVHITVDVLLDYYFPI